MRAGRVLGPGGSLDGEHSGWPRMFRAEDLGAERGLCYLITLVRGRRS